jgi:hypothetical protein
MRVFAALVAVSTLSSPAMAQYEPLKFAICKKVASDPDRLKCFDEIGKDAAAASTEAPAQAGLKPPGQWAFTESKSPIDDSPQVNALLVGDGPDAAGLFVRCHEKQTEVIFTPGGRFYVTEPAKVLVRLNDLPAITTTWSPSTTNKSLFARNAIDFIKTLPDNGKLFMRGFGFQGRDGDASFSLGNISEVKERVSSACKWAGPKAAKASK